MKELSKKILRSAGILCAIGAVGGLVIAGVNAWTSPIIAKNNAEKAAATYKVIFPTLTKVGDSVAVSGKYVSSYVIAYNGDSEIGRIYTGTASYGQTVNMKIMVGMSTENGKTVLGKVSILNNGATGGFDTTVVTNYVNPYNDDPSDTTLAAVKCGATAAATSIKMIVSEAKDLYESGGSVEDLDGEIKSIFANEAAYSDPVDVSGKTYLSKYYAVYADAAKSSYLGTAYRLAGTATDGTTITLIGGLSGTIASPSYGKIALVKSSADLSADITAYNAAPSADQFASWSNAAAGVLAKSMMEEAASAYAAGLGNLNPEGYAVQIYAGTKALGDGNALSGKSYLKTVYVAYGDEAKTTDVGHVYYASGSISWNNEASEEDTVNISLYVGVKEGKLGKLVILSDNSQYDDSGYITSYNTTPSDSIDVKCGATYSATLIQNIVKEALSTNQGGDK